MMPATIRRFAILSLLLLPLAGCARAAAPGPETDAAVTAVLEKFYGAMKTGDNAAAMSVLAPDAIFLESGRLETRDEYEKNHLPADIEFEKQVNGKRGPWRITVHDDTAWVIAVTEFVGTFNDSPVNSVSAQLAVLTRESGEWLIRSIHWSGYRR
jgi:ketosteroid isomerase-like protein